MIRQSYVVVTILLTISVFAHAAVLSIPDEPETFSIGGGAEASVAQLGDNFQAMAVGVLQAAPATETTTDVPNVLQTADGFLVTIAPTKPILDAKEPTAQPTKTIKATDPVAVLSALQPDVVRPAAPLQTQTNNAVPLTLPVTPAVSSELTPLVQQSVQASLDKNTEDSLRASRRPSVRPKSLEQEVAQSQPTPKRAKASPPKKDKKQQARGNAKRQATAGASNGEKTASATVAGKRKSGKATQGANAAVSNYPGLVSRKIARQKRPKAATKAAAIVSFTIAASGAIAKISIIKSSGSAKFDKSAVVLVRRASPFPKPPSGAKRSYNVKVKGR
jgi:protein TonB